MNYKARKDGKFLVTRIINGRLFRNIIPASELPAMIERENARAKLSPEEEAKRAIPFGQPGYVG